MRAGKGLGTFFATDGSRALNAARNGFWEDALWEILSLPSRLPPEIRWTSAAEAEEWAAGRRALFEMMGADLAGLIEPSGWGVTLYCLADTPSVGFNIPREMTCMNSTELASPGEARVEWESYTGRVPERWISG